jgi:two-component system, LytTR family, response regulator
MMDHPNIAIESTVGEFVPSRLSSKANQSKDNTGEKLRIAIIDDEALARRALRRVIERRSDNEIVGECSDGSEAVKMLQETHPDLIFLDIEMPQLNGFEVIERIKPNEVPHIVFVTAHEQYALDAFKVHAIDFLIKPIREEKIDEVLQRVSRLIEQTLIHKTNSRLDSILQILGTRDQNPPQREILERISIKDKGRIYFVETSSVDWIQANGNYITLHTGSSKHLVRMKMSCLEDKLDPKTFIRIHRSVIVNVHSIKELRPYFSGAYTLLLHDKTKIYSSRGHRKQVEQIVNRLA